MCPVNNCVLPVGALVVIKGQDSHTILPGPPPTGDIIVFHVPTEGPDFLVIHRVIRIIIANQSQNGYFFVTKGDANGVEDSWDTPGVANPWPNNPYGGVPANQIVGVYQYTIPIPYLGSAILDIRNFMYDDATQQPRPEGILVIVILIIALFAFEVIEPSKKPKAEAKAETSSSEMKSEPAPVGTP